MKLLKVTILLFFACWISFCNLLNKDTGSAHDTAGSINEDDTSKGDTIQTGAPPAEDSAADTAHGDTAHADTALTDTTDTDTSAQNDTTGADTTASDTATVDSAHYHNLLRETFHLGVERIAAELQGEYMEKIPFEISQPVRSDTAGYHLAIFQFGLYQKAVLKARVITPDSVLLRTASALVIQEQPMDSFPSIGLMNKTGSMVLAGSSEISGPVLMRRGFVRKATSLKVRYSGTTRQVELLDYDYMLWQTLPLVFPGVELWISRHAGLPDTVANGGAIEPDSAYLSDVRIAGSKAVQSGMITILLRVRPISRANFCPVTKW